MNFIVQWAVITILQDKQKSTKLNIFARFQCPVISINLSTKKKKESFLTPLLYVCCSTLDISSSWRPPLTRQQDTFSYRNTAVDRWIHCIGRVPHDSSPCIWTAAKYNGTDRPFDDGRDHKRDECDSRPQNLATARVIRTPTLDTYRNKAAAHGPSDDCARRIIFSKLFSLSSENSLKFKFPSSSYPSEKRYFTVSLSCNSQNGAVPFSCSTAWNKKKPTEPDCYITLYCIQFMICNRIGYRKKLRSRYSILLRILLMVKEFGTRQNRSWVKALTKTFRESKRGLVLSENADSRSWANNQTSSAKWH